MRMWIEEETRTIFWLVSSAEIAGAIVGVPAAATSRDANAAVRENAPPALTVQSRSPWPVGMPQIVTLRPEAVKDFVSGVVQMFCASAS